MTSDLIADSAERLFGKYPTAGSSWSAPLWNAVEEAGFALTLLSEADGGFGLDPAEAMEPLRISASHAAPVPLAETMLANWLLVVAGLDPQEGPTAVAFGSTTRRVPFGRHLVQLLVCQPAGVACQLALHPVTDGDWRQGTAICGEPRDDLARLPPATKVGHLPLDPRVPPAVFAVLRVTQMAGALQAVLEMTTRYARERVQFGRALARFQTIQQYLAVMAAETAAAAAAAQMAAATLPLAGRDPDRLVLLAAAGKIRAGEAAGKVADLAHQVHGAIGFSQEYPLHPLTRRLWDWRDEGGREADHAVTLGAALAAGGPLWPQITALQSECF